MNKITKSQVFTGAWNFARKAAAKFGGNALYMGRSSSMTAWEKQFVNDMAGRFAKFGDSIKISEKQADILRRIAAKA